MSSKPLVVDFKGLKRMGWPFSRTETERGDGSKYPRSYKLGVHRSSRRMWRVAEILAYFESHGLHVASDWENSQ